jgi:hypothetical protein
MSRSSPPADSVLSPDFALPGKNVKKEIAQRAGFFHFLPNKGIGKFEGLDDKFAEILETDRHCFRGFQATLQNILHQHFLVIHSIELGKNENITPEGKKDEERSAYSITGYMRKAPWLFNARYSNGTTNANCIYDNGGVVITSQGHFSEDENKSNFEIDFAFKHQDMVIQLKTSGLEAYGFSYTQPVGKRLGFGGEVYLSPFQDKGRLKLMGLYNNDENKDSTLATVITGMGPDQLTLSYLKKVNPSLGILTEADFSLDRTSKQGGPKLTSVLKLGYSFKSDLPGASMARAIVDTTGGVACVIDDAFNENCSVTLTAKINYFKNLYDFGVGVVVSM